MNNKDLILKLAQNRNGGNAFLILNYLLLNDSKEIFISQDHLALDLNFTRPTVKKALLLLKKMKLVKISYGKIKIINCL